jgi:DNA-binding NarL/FixJ family response regulator
MLRVALCDDDANFRTLVRVVLTGEADMEVVSESCDGLDCVDQITETRPDAVLLDLVMPKMFGFEAIQKLSDASPETKVIVLSSQPADRVEEAVLRLGAVGFIEKGGGGVVDSLPGQVRAALANA